MKVKIIKYVLIMFICHENVLTRSSSCIKVSFVLNNFFFESHQSRFFCFGSRSWRTVHTVGSLENMIFSMNATL